MTLIQYKEPRFRKPVLETIERANIILTEMAKQGYVLTLRQLFYQFVRRNWIANQEREYKRLGRIVTDAREAGVMSWTAIEDRGRGTATYGYQEDPASTLRGIEFRLNVDRWARQDHYVEVWVEKQALESVVARPCRALHVPFMARKGYLSASEALRAGQRFEAIKADGRKPVVIHLGDHDPSGIDMTRDNADRLALYARYGVEVRRVALNMDQIEEHNPPPSPTKVSDSRAKGYIDAYGSSCWELDALEPKTLDELIRSSVGDYIDDAKWKAAGALEAELRAPLSLLHDRYDELSQLVTIDGRPLDRLAAYDERVPAIADRLDEVAGWLAAEDPDNPDEASLIAHGAETDELRELGK